MTEDKLLNCDMELKPKNHMFLVEHEGEVSIVEGGEIVSVTLNDFVIDISMKIPNLSKDEIKRLGVEGIKSLVPHSYTEKDK